MVKVEFNKINSYKELSGHMYRGSSYETSNSCGNCDGARCDDCEPMYTIYNKETGEDIPLYIEDPSILRRLTDVENLEYAYYLIDFKYEGDCLDSDGKELYNLLNKLFIQAHGIDNKDTKTISYHILLSVDDLDMEDYINIMMKKEGIKYITISRIVSNKTQD